MSSFGNEPDKMEKGVRFGCGAIFGLLVGIGVSVRLLHNVNVFCILGVALLLGFLAMKFGDHFWRNWFGD